MKIDWNYERYRTRDRLLEYDTNIMPPAPHVAGLTSVYPWEDIRFPIIQQAIYNISKNSGYTGSYSDFINNFGRYLEHKNQIVFGTYETFPIIGQNNQLYFDIETSTLYYWNETEYDVVRAMLIVDAILNCGDATNI